MSHSDRRMPVLMTGHAVNIHDNILVRVGMAIDTRSRSGVLDVTVRAVHGCM